MKATKLTVSNIGIVADAVIEINKPLIVFYGDIMQGKTTLLNSVKWVMGGAFPDDILRHGASEAFIQFEAVEDGKPVVIRREWYRGKDQTVKARAIQMTRNGVPVKKPVDEIARFLNPFLLDQDYLRKMNDRERAAYMVKLFAVDTSAEDAAIAAMAEEAAELRAKVKGYGEIDLTPAETVDVAALQAELTAAREAHGRCVAEARAELKRIQDEHFAACTAIEEANSEAREHNSQHDQCINDRQVYKTDIARIDQQIAELTAQRAAKVNAMEEVEAWLRANAKRELAPRPAMPDVSAIQARIDATCDTSAIQAKLTEAGAANVRAEQYRKNLERAKAKAADEKKVLDLERGQRELKADKTAKLAALGDKCGVDGLAFCEDGSFSFEGVSAGMLSDSQIMRLSQRLSALYPEGFGISLIDRGESLGKSVLELWKQAQEHDRSILVSVVGDKPAQIPEQVGAFVVESGKLF